MPQMSPMNWMLISILMPMVLNLTKTNLNNSFKSKMNQMKKYFNNKNKMLW